MTIERAGHTGHYRPSLVVMQTYDPRERGEGAGDTMGQAIRVAAALGLLALVGLLMTAPAQAEDYPTGNRDSMWSDPATYMIGSFRHMGEIYPSRPVHRAGPVSALPPGTALGAARL